ncbi:MAG: CotH kinase family protein [Bacteroidia bacterium]|nr:CotH kinase family protein [Bacteroidia bacterium]
MKRIYNAALFYSSAFFLSFAQVTSAQVVINEYSCSNLNQFVDNHSDYEDWFELYNTSATGINLAGYFLSDDSLNNMKWQVPSGISINGNGFGRFWTSGRNEVSGTNYHTNFKLHQTKNNAEFVVLSNPAGVILDYVKLNSSNRTQLGHSRGRSPDGTNAWNVFTTPTPNTSNNFSTTYLGYAAKPSFDLSAGFYPSAVTVTITNNEPNSTIYYTLDGALPTVASPVYSAPITISTTKVLKAFAKSNNPQILSSFLEFSTFFINEPHTMSVVSIAATQLTQLANGSGSLRPYGSCEYFDKDGIRKAKTYGEFNRHGQDSWANSQRSIDFVSRDEMGYNHAIKEQLFPQTPRDSYQRVIFRAAGDDNFPADYHTANLGSAHVRDAYVHMLASNGGMSLDVRKAVKTLVFMNGQYWGVYDIRDNPDDHDNTNYYYGQGKYQIQFLETWGNTWAQYGGAQALTDWSALRSFILGNSMLVPANYQYVTSQLDVASLADYVLANSFTVCTDWLNYNTGWWRGMDTTGTHRKWGYILWDLDATFRFYINYTNVPSTQYYAPICNPQTLISSYNDPQQHLQVLNKLMTNPEFNTWYINRAIDLWNTVFSCQNMLHQLDSIVLVLTPEMPRHSIRWNGQLTDWQNNVQTLRTFINNRCNYLTTGFINCYSLTGPYNVILNTDPPNSGTIQLNSLSLSQFPWSGTYYGNITTSLQANAGSVAYVFNNWTTLGQLLNPNLSSAAVTANITNSDTITAHFSIITAIGNYPGIETNVTAYPTIFSEETTVEYTLPERLPVTIKLMTMLGTEVTCIKSPSEFVQRGNYSVKLNLAGSSVSAGVYLLKFTAGDFSKTIKLVYSPK